MASDIYCFPRKKKGRKESPVLSDPFPTINKNLNVSFWKYMGNILNKINYKNKLGEGEWHSHRTGDSRLKCSTVSGKCSAVVFFLYLHLRSYRLECQCLHLRSYIYNSSYIRGFSKSQ
jgi:hypothetical protein